MTTILAVVGDCGVGKTTFIDQLNIYIGWDRLSIDDERSGGGDWPTLIRRVRALQTPTIIESVAMPAEYRIALRNHMNRTWWIVCDERVRQARIAERFDQIKRKPISYPRGFSSRTIDTSLPLKVDLMSDLRSSMRQWQNS